MLFNLIVGTPCPRKTDRLTTQVGWTPWFVRLLVLCWFSFTILAGTFQSTLDRAQISLGESATLQAVLQDEEAKSAPSLPQVPGLTIRSTGTSQQLSIVNGQTTHSQVFSFNITASKEGVYRIPAITIRTESKVMTTQPVTLRVAKGEAINANGQVAFARVVPSKKEVYVGEIIPADIQFFVTEGRNLQGPQIKGDGFVVNKILSPMQNKMQINNMIYNVLVYKTAITASKVGKIEFGPVSFGIEVRQNARRTGNDPLADFFGGGVNYQEISVLSDTVTMNVLPLPAPPPGIGFLGAVGNFSMQVKAGPVAVTVGDPITLKIDIRGKGSLDTMTLPSLSWDHFKSYPATSTIQISDTLGIEGVKSFEQVVIPEGLEAKSIPVIRFSFFDPENRRYVTMTNSSIALTVSASGQPTAQATVVQAKSDETGQPIASDLEHIKPDLGQLRAIRKPLLTQPWFWASNAIPCLAWVGFVAWFRNKERQRNNPRFQRRLQTQKFIHEGLLELHNAAEQQDEVRFYTQAFRMLQEHLGERLDLPSLSVTETSMEHPLAQLDSDPQVQTELKDLFQICNLARYAGAQNEQSLSEVLSRLEIVLNKDQPLRNSRSKTMLSLLPWMIIGITCSAFANESELNSRFIEANKAYEQGKFQQSLVQYQSIQTNGTSPALLLNLANAAWKSGQQGLAIRSLAEAAQLAPHDSDIKSNLKFLRQRVNRPIESISETIASTFSFNEVALCFLTSNIVLFGVLIYRKRPNTNPRSLALYVAVGLFTLASVLLITSITVRHSRVVVMVKEVSVKFGPVEESKAAFTARDGTELRLLHQRDHWFQVTDAGKRIGWVKQTDVSVLP